MSGQVQVQRVSSGERRMVAQGDTGYYVPTGHLVYVQAATGTLVAVPFDLTRLQVGAAAPVAVAEGILVRRGRRALHVVRQRAVGLCCRPLRLR